MSRFVDSVVVYRILRLLSTPVVHSDAYKLGIIDKDGKKIKEPNGNSELEAYSLLNRFIFKVQKSLMKSPDRDSRRLLTFAAALAVLREYSEHDEDLDVDTLLEVYEKDPKVQEQARMLGDYNLLSFRNYMEEMMGVGGGAIAGIGIGPAGEPGVSKKKQKEIQKQGGVVVRRNSK
tara:strand:+ start:1162 stop:1689 length:528 start_codon:yes stop_codon:yes gene_type:complete